MNIDSSGDPRRFWISANDDMFCNVSEQDNIFLAELITCPLEDGNKGALADERRWRAQSRGEV